MALPLKRSKSLLGSARTTQKKAHERQQVNRVAWQWLKESGVIHETTILYPNWPRLEPELNLK